MFDYWIRYEKTDNAKYISHLDFVRAFNRTMRRAKLPIAFSEGFNPHPLLSFALPLSVGYTSECEMLEMVCTREIAEEEIVETLNAVIPRGICILSAHKGKSRMKAIDYALYEVFAQQLPPSVEEFLARTEAVIEKKTKSGVKETDVRGDIRDIRLLPDRMEMVLAAGSRANLKPEVVVRALEKYLPNYCAGDCDYHRRAVYDKELNMI